MSQPELAATTPGLIVQAAPVRRPRWMETRAGLAWMLGALLVVLILLPLAFMFVGAVRTGGFADPQAQFTLEKLRLVYATLPYLRALAITVGVSALVGALATVAGAVLAWLMSRTDLPAKRWLENCIIAPLFLSPFVSAMAWLVLGSPRAGFINGVARNLLGTTEPVVNMISPAGIVFVMTLSFIPYAYLTLTAALRGIDPALEEASYLNGGGIIRTALRITLPVVRPALISAFFFVFVLTAGTFAIPAVLGGSAQLPFLAVDVYNASAAYPIDYGLSAAIGTLLFWISLAGISLYQFASRAASRFVTITARGYRIRLVRLRGWTLPAVLLVLLYVFLAIVLPYLALIYAAFTSYITPSIWQAPWTLQNVTTTAGSPAVMQSIWNTLLTSLISPTLCVLLGVGLAYAIRRRRIRGGRLLDYLAMFPIAVPGVVFGAGMFWIYITTPVYGTIWILVIAFVASYLPFAYRIADTSLLQIDKALEEASLLCGGSHVRTLFQVTLKLMRPALLSAWIMVFIFCVREISAAILLASPSNKVLSVLSWDYLEFGDLSKASVIGLLQTALLVLGVVVGQGVLRVRLSQSV